MPKKKSAPLKSKPGKMLFTIVVAVLAGAALMFGVVMLIGSKAKQKQTQLAEKEQKITQLAPMVDQAFVSVAKLADEQNLTDAVSTGQEAVSQIDEIMRLNQEIADETSGKPQEIARKRQEVFAAQKKALEKLVECAQLENIESPKGKVCQQEFIDLSQNLQVRLQEFKELTGMVESSEN